MHSLTEKLRLGFVLAASVSISLFAGFSHAAEEITPAPAFTIEQLSTPRQDGWITNGGTLSNQRYSPLDQINRDTVKNLKGVWRTGLNSALEFRHNNQAQPIVYDGIIYIITGQNDVFAI